MKTNRPKLSYDEICKNFFQLHGAISFTESKSNLLMWSHYTYEHKGIVLGFDPQSTFFNDLKRVKYDSIISDDILDSIDINDNETLMQLFYLKSDEWIYEKEHRIVKELSYCDYLLDEGKIKKMGDCLNLVSKVFFTVPYDALLKIYFGCRMTRKIKKDSSKN